jgi:hypothetical protein
MDTLTVVDTNTASHTDLGLAGNDENMKKISLKRKADGSVDLGSISPFLFLKKKERPMDSPEVKKEKEERVQKWIKDLNAARKEYRNGNKKSK